jgi:pyruvate formate lyase activating enzyme
MKESYSYKKLEDKTVRCCTCAHRCFILPDKFGLCGVRKNVGGRLYVLNYGKVITKSIDPIEKKPLFHFHPGTTSFSIASVGCNLSCGNCQNWQISQTVKQDRSMLETGNDETAQEIVNSALKNGCPSISYTYTEPTIFLEFALDTMRLARARHLKNVWVSNGFMTEETLVMIIPYLDAANIDIKAYDEKFYERYCGARLEPVLENCKRLKDAGVWLEITTLIIPGLSDDEEMLKRTAGFIATVLGTETPWHLSAFYGSLSWKMRDISNTDTDRLRSAWRIGKEAGLEFVYAGNLPLDM